MQLVKWVNSAFQPPCKEKVTSSNSDLHSSNVYSVLKAVAYSYFLSCEEKK